MSSRNDPTVVLAHGARADGSSWEKVTRGLRSAGLRSATAPLPLTSWTDDVAALAPDEGETVGDVFYRAEPHPKVPKLAPDTHGLIWLPEEAFPAAFAPDASAEEQAVLFAVQRPIAVPCISTKVGRPLWRERPTWFLLAEADHMTVPATQRFMARRMKAEIRSHRVDHTPSVTAPHVVVDTILEAARFVSAI